MILISVNLLIKIFEEKKKILIKTEIQLAINDIERIFTEGSNDENRFIIYS